MGVDITMMVVNHKNPNEVIMTDLYNGRDYDFFSLLQNQEEVDFPCHRGIPEGVTEGDLFDLYENGGHYDFSYITIKDFLKWINDYRPQLDAGWVTKYEAWAYRTRGVIPEVHHEYPEYYAAAENLEFIEICDYNNPFFAIREEIEKFFKEQNPSFQTSLQTAETAKKWIEFVNNYIVYCFDC